MRRKYTRLKLKMLLFVVAGTLVAGLAGLFLLEVVVDGVLQDPFARFFVWAARTLFGQSEYEALELYRQAIRGNKQAFLTGGHAGADAGGVLPGHGALYPLAGGDPPGAAPGGGRAGRAGAPAHGNSLRSRKIWTRSSVR